jgi:hypothetical protein
VAAAKLPATGLGPDTQQAAEGSTVEGMGYVGVWAKDAAGCAAIDQPAAADFAVITNSTIRQGANACYGNFAPLKDGKASLPVGCPAAGNSPVVDISMASPDALQIDAGPALIRCSK